MKRFRTLRTVEERRRRELRPYRIKYEEKSESISTGKYFEEITLEWNIEFRMGIIPGMIHGREINQVTVRSSDWRNEPERLYVRAFVVKWKI